MPPPLRLRVASVGRHRLYHAPRPHALHVSSCVSSALQPFSARYPNGPLSAAENKGVPGQVQPSRARGDPRVRQERRGTARSASPRPSTTSRVSASGSSAGRTSFFILHDITSACISRTASWTSTAPSARYHLLPRVGALGVKGRATASVKVKHTMYSRQGPEGLAMECDYLIVGRWGEDCFRR